MKKIKTATEAFIEQKKTTHVRKSRDVVTAHCQKHNGLCIYVWCKNHQIYEHAMENLT